MSPKQVVVLAAANRRSSTFWSGAELGYDMMSPGKSSHDASPESVWELCEPLG